VRQVLLYEADAGRPRRPGEPVRARLVELDAGARWCWAEADTRERDRELLVVSGDLRIAGRELGLRDYRRLPAGHPDSEWTSSAGALVFVRESIGEGRAASTGPAGSTSATWVLDDASDWPAFAPGIRRRVLWESDGQAALLYHVDPGSSVPLHSHGHDEECLMVQGDLFLDDILLQAGDYQLAPAGTSHRETRTDTGAVIYAHGDRDLRFIDTTAGSG
jgi:quercetin dioxygenase-like cupin family protein